MGNFRAGRGHAVRALAHGAHHLREAVLHVTQGFAQLANFIAAVDGHFLAQIACANALGNRAGTFYAVGNAARQAPADKHGQRNGQQAQHCRQLVELAEHGFHFLLGSGHGIGFTVHHLLRCLNVGIRGWNELGAHKVLHRLVVRVHAHLVDFFAGAQPHLAHFAHFLSALQRCRAVLCHAQKGFLLLIGGA